MTPLPQLGPRVIYQGDVVILGETRVDPHDSSFRREIVADVWPNIAFPRAPIGIHHANAEPVLGDANNVILFSVGRPYRRISVEQRGSWTEWIEVRPDVLGEMVREYEPRASATDSTPFQLGRAPTPDHAYLTHRRARQKLVDAESVDGAELEETALGVAGEIVAAGFAALGIRRRAEPRRSIRRQRQIAYDVQALLNHQLGRPLRLTEISHAVDVSPFHLCRVFRVQTGVPIHRYRNGLRLRAALERIAEKNVRMLDVALDLGFASEAHFSDSFHAAFGMRPTEYRRSLSGRLQPRPR